MQRSSAVLLVAGAAGLLVLLGVLVRAVHSEAPEATPTVSSEPSSSPQTASPHASASGPVASRTPDASGRRPSIWRAPGIRIDRGGDSAPVADTQESAPPATEDNKQNLHFGGTQLREQTKAVGVKVQRCVDDANKKGLSPTGEAMLTYVVAKHGDKYEVETTGIDDEKTTLQNTELLDCLRTTALAMHFEGLPREATSIVASRVVKLEAGKVVEYKHVSFSYLR
jgi:hypothetical protein